MNELSQWRSKSLAASIRGILMTATFAASMAGQATQATNGSGCDMSTNCDSSSQLLSPGSEVKSFYAGEQA